VNDSIVLNALQPPT